LHKLQAKSSRQQEDKMFGKTKVRKQDLSPYAVRSDFCRIFEKDMNRLHLLSFLLTGDRIIADQCFVGGLHIAQEGNHVFKEWAESWARRAIIQNAIRMIRPRKTTDATLPTAPSDGDVATPHAEIAGIVALPAFERFVFVMSVLERYSDQECALLLGCARSDVTEARTRAFEQLGKSAELHRKLVSIGLNQKTERDNSGSAPQLTAAHSLAVSA
jgi:DNA-directed RNA polymerase specialized sigma24 family protein